VHVAAKKALFLGLFNDALLTIQVMWNDCEWWNGMDAYFKVLSHIFTGINFGYLMTLFHLHWLYSNGKMMLF